MYSKVFPSIMASGIRKLYIAQCPKCKEPLKEISYVPVYRCGSCNTILLANCWKIVLDRVASASPESISPQKNASSNGDNSNSLISDGSMITACNTSDTVNQALETKAERKIDTDDVNGFFGSGSCGKHNEGDQLDKEDFSHLKDVNTFYNKQDKESLCPMPFDEHIPRDETDNGISIVDYPLTSGSNGNSSCLKDVYTVYNEQETESLPLNPLSESIFDVGVQDGGHNWNDNLVEDSTVNNDESAEASDHNDMSEEQSDISLFNGRAMDTECSDVHGKTFSVSYPDDKCGFCMSEGAETLDFATLERNTSQKRNPEYIFDEMTEDKSHHLNAAGLAEISTEKNEEFAEPSDDSDISEKVIGDESPSKEATVNRGSSNIHIYTPFKDGSSSSDRCVNPTSTEPETWNFENLKCNRYEQHSTGSFFNEQRESKGNSLEPHQVETSSNYNEQSVVPSGPDYKPENVLVEECFSSDPYPTIHLDTLHGNVSPSADDKCTKISFGEHKSWNIEKPKYNPYQQINSFDFLDNTEYSLRMHQTSDNKSIVGSSSVSNFCDRVEAGFIDVEGSTIFTENTVGFQESVNSIVAKQVLDSNLSIGGTDNTKPAKELVDMYLHEKENGSGDESDDCQSISMDAIEKSTCLIGDDNGDEENDEFTAVFTEIIENENCSVMSLRNSPINSPTCQASRTTSVEELTDWSVIIEESISSKAEMTEDISLPIHTSSLDFEKNTIQQILDVGQCTFGNSHEFSTSLVDGENNIDKNGREKATCKYDGNEVGDEERSICDQTSDISVDTIFHAESSRLVEEAAKSRTQLIVQEETAYNKLNNETDKHTELPVNMLPSTVIDMSKGRSDDGQYILSNTKESLFNSVDTAKTHIKGDQADSDQIYSSFGSEGCIYINQQRISSTDDAVSGKTSMTVTEPRESTDLVVIQGVVIEQDLDSARVKNMEHSVLMHSNSLLKKESGKESSTHQHTVCDENATMHFILDAASSDKDNPANNVASPSSLPRYYSFKQGSNDRGEDSEYRHPSMPLILDDATCANEIMQDKVVTVASPLSTPHCYLSEKEVKNESNGNKQIAGSEHISINILISAGGNDGSTCLLSNEKAAIDQDLLSVRSHDIQYPFNICNRLSQVTSEKGTDHVHSTLGNGDKCLSHALPMNASEKSDNDTLGNESERLLSSEESILITDQDNKNVDDAVTSSRFSLPVSKHAIDDDQQVYKYLCEQTEYLEDDVHKSHTSRPIEDLEKPFNPSATTKEAPDLSPLDERTNNMTPSIHMLPHYLLRNCAEKESTMNHCASSRKDFGFGLNDGNTHENEKEACGDATDRTTVYSNSEQMDASNYVSNSTRTLVAMEEKEDVLGDQAGGLCVIERKYRISMLSNNINPDAHGETLTFSNSGRWNQIKTENLVLQRHASFSSKDNILTYESDNNGHGLKEGKVFSMEATLCSLAADTDDVAADTDDTRPGRYLDKLPSYNPCTLKSEQLTEKVEVTGSYSKLNKQVDDFDNWTSSTVSYGPEKVTDYVQSSKSSHLFNKEVTDVNHNTNRYALSPTHKSSLDHDGCFSSIDEVYWNHVSSQRRGRRSLRPQKTRGSLAVKENNKGDLASANNEMTKLSAPAKTRLLSKHRHTFPKNESSGLHHKQDGSDSEEFYSAENKTASESEVPKARWPRSKKLAACKLISYHHNTLKSKISEEEHRELVRKIDELRNQLRSSHDQTGGYNPTFTRDIERVKQQLLVKRHHLAQEQFQPFPSTSQASRAGTLRSVERASEKHMFLQMSNSGNVRCYLNQRQEYNQFVNRMSPFSPSVSRPNRVQHIPPGKGLQVHSEPRSPFSSYGTPKQEHGIRKVQQRGYHQTKKQHCRPILGGAQFIICNECLQLLRMPEDFQISKKCYKLRCGSCSAVLEFSLIGRTHIVPLMTKQS